MLGIFFSWLVLFLAGIFAAVKGLLRRCPGTALGAAMGVAVMSGTWLAPTIVGIPVDVRVALAVVLLLAFCVHTAGKFRFPWIWLDTIAIGFLMVGAVSDLRFSGFTFVDPARVYGELVLPYFTGRFVSMRKGAARGSAVWFVVAGIIVSAGAIAEAFIGVNLWEVLFAPKDDLVTHRGGVRFGLLHRATGPTRHSIFLGVVLMMIVPWCISLIGRSDAKWGKGLGWVGLVAILAGVGATMSRGPILGLVIAVLVSIAIVWPSTFKWFTGASVLFALLTFIFWIQAISWMDSTQSSESVRGHVVEVDGEAEIYTGTRNRLWVWEIYGPLVIKGGPLGFGTEAVSSFPPNIPGLPASAKARETLGIVDNSYLLTGLRFGWVGLTLFVMLIGGSVVTAIRLRRSAGMILYPDGPAFLTAMASILVGVAFVMLTVFSSFDFMFWVYFHCGVVAGLASLRDSMLRGDVDAVA